MLLNKFNILLVFFSLLFSNSFDIVLGTRNDDLSVFDDLIGGFELKFEYEVSNYNRKLIISDNSDIDKRSIGLARNINPKKSLTWNSPKTFIDYEDLEPHFSIEEPSGIDVKTFSVIMSKNACQVRGYPASLYCDLSDADFKINNENGTAEINISDEGKVYFVNLEIGDSPIEVVDQNCFKNSKRKNETYKLDIKNTSNQSITIRLKAKCGCSFRDIDCKDSYDYEFTNMSDLGTNIKTIRAGKSSRISLNNSNWTQLQYSILKSGSSPSDYFNVLNDEIIIDQRIIRQLFPQATAEYSFDENGPWGTGLKTIEYIFAGTQYSKRADQSFSFQSSDIRQIEVNGYPAKINDITKKIIEDKPVLVIIDFNVSGKNNKKTKPAFKDKVKEIFNNNPHVQFYKFLTFFPSGESDFDLLNFKSINRVYSDDDSGNDYTLENGKVKTDKYTQDSFEDLNKEIRSSGNKSSVFYENHIYTFEPILSAEQFSNMSVSDIKESSADEWYLNRINRFNAIENIKKYSQIYYLTANDPEEISRIDNQIIVKSVFDIKNNEFK